MHVQLFSSRVLSILRAGTPHAYTLGGVGLKRVYVHCSICLRMCELLGAHSSIVCRASACTVIPLRARSIWRNTARDCQRNAVVVVWW